MGEATPGIIIATQVAVIMTPTRTSILFEAGPVLVNATYLSPVVVRFSSMLDAVHASDIP